VGGVGSAALAYFAAVFAVGFVLGVGRELVVRPYLGTLASIMVEAPAMLLACWGAARWVVRRFAVPREARLRLGLLAFGLLMAAELVGSMGLRGMAPAEWVAQFATPPGLLSLVLFAGFAAMPRMVR
jgi:hypothetical protein